MLQIFMQEVFKAVSSIPSKSWIAAGEKKAAKKDAEEKRKIAKLFNDRFTYCNPYVEVGPPMREGKVPEWREDACRRQAWMCHECCKIHHPVEYSCFTGLIYPACCSSIEGDRFLIHSETIRIPRIAFQY